MLVDMKETHLFVTETIMKQVYLKSVLFLGIVALAGSARAQQDPYYTHFKFVKQSYNPAAAGEKDDLVCVNGLWHSQWRNYDDLTQVDRRDGTIPDGQSPIKNVAPVTYALNLSGQITADKGKRKIGGIGLSLYDDKLGFMKQTTVRLQAAYFIPVQGNFGRLAIGPEVGMYQFGFVNPQFIARDPNDPRVPTTGSNDTKFDLGFGAYYQQRRLGPVEDFYAGLSMSHITAPTYTVTATQQSTVNFKQEPHWYLVSGGRIPLGNPAFELEPAILLKYKTRFQLDLNTTVLWNQMARAGIGYRQWGNSDAISIMLGYIYKDIQIGYSYDVTLSTIRTVSNGTHEIMVAYCFPLNVQPEPKTKNFYRNTRDL